MLVRAGVGYESVSGERGESLLASVESARVRVKPTTRGSVETDRSVCVSAGATIGSKSGDTEVCGTGEGEAAISRVTREIAEAGEAATTAVTNGAAVATTTKATPKAATTTPTKAAGTVSEAPKIAPTTRTTCSRRAQRCRERRDGGAERKPSFIRLREETERGCVKRTKETITELKIIGKRFAIAEATTDDETLGTAGLPEAAGFIANCAA